MNARRLLQQKAPGVITISVDATLKQAIATLDHHGIGAVVVLAPDGEMRGILSERDIIRLLSGAPTGYRETPVAEVMTAGVLTCSPDSSVDALMRLMTAARIRHVPVLEDGTLIGILSIGDVVKAQIAEAMHEAAALKEYISAG